MAYKEWKREYSVSVKRFNDDHRQLFQYLNDLHQGLISGLNISDMGYILKGLMEYTIVHFQEEERMMKKFNYPEFESHRIEHEMLLKRVGEFYRDFIQGKKAFSLELLSFLDDWVTSHILTMDMKYKPFFEDIGRRQKAGKVSV